MTTCHFNIKPTTGHVLVKRNQNQGQGSSKIKIATGIDSEKSRVENGVVVSAADGSEFKEGDIVFYNKSAIMDTSYNGEFFGILDVRAVFAYTKSE